MLKMAGREGFEPSVGASPTPNFESGTFNHSATSPWRGLYESYRLSLKCFGQVFWVAVFCAGAARSAAFLKWVSICYNLRHPILQQLASSD